MTLNEACFLLMSALKINKPGNVLVLNMGKPIKILNIIKSLIELRQKIEPDYTYVIKGIGLQKGEKMNEQHTINKKLKKTNNKDIDIVTDPTYKDESTDKLLSRLKENNNPQIAIKLMKNFLSKDFKN